MDFLWRFHVNDHCHCSLTKEMTEEKLFIAYNFDSFSISNNNLFVTPIIIIIL